MADIIQQRRDTAARWAQYNPILLEGEVGYVTDNPNQYKIGNGRDRWNNLPLRGYTGTIAQDTGDDENAVMSQKAVTEKLSELGSEVGYCFGKNEITIPKGGRLAYLLDVSSVENIILQLQGNVSNNAKYSIYKTDKNKSQYISLYENVGLGETFFLSIDEEFPVIYLLGNSEDNNTSYNLIYSIIDNSFNLGYLQNIHSKHSFNEINECLAKVIGEKYIDFSSKNTRIYHYEDFSLYSKAIIKLQTDSSYFTTYSVFKTDEAHNVFNVLKEGVFKEESIIVDIDANYPILYFIADNIDNNEVDAIPYKLSISSIDTTISDAVKNISNLRCIIPTEISKQVYESIDNRIILYVPIPYEKSLIKVSCVNPIVESFDLYKTDSGRTKYEKIGSMQFESELYIERDDLYPILYILASGTDGVLPEPIQYTISFTRFKENNQPNIPTNATLQKQSIFIKNSNISRRKGMFIFHMDCGGDFFTNETYKEYVSLLSQYRIYNSSFAFLPSQLRDSRKIEAMQYLYDLGQDICIHSDSDRDNYENKDEYVEHCFEVFNNLGIDVDGWVSLSGNDSIEVKTAARKYISWGTTDNTTNESPHGYRIDDGSWIGALMTLKDSPLDLRRGTGELRGVYTEDYEEQCVQGLKNIIDKVCEDKSYFVWYNHSFNNFEAPYTLRKTLLLKILPYIKEKISKGLLVCGGTSECLNYYYNKRFDE